MNGTDKLKLLFKNQDDFIEFFIKNCFFISTKSVEERAKEMLKTIQLGEKLPIRYGNCFLKRKNLSS